MKRSMAPAKNFTKMTIAQELSICERVTTSDPFLRTWSWLIFSCCTAGIRLKQNPSCALFSKRFTAASEGGALSGPCSTESASLMVFLHLSLRASGKYCTDVSIRTATTLRCM